jgi:hypothetical protein
MSWILNIAVCTKLTGIQMLLPLYPFSLYHDLSPLGADASVFLTYATDPYSYFVGCLLSGRILFATVSLATIFSDFLPLLLANIPFNRTRTFTAYVVCSWLSVGILVFMISVLAMLIAVVVVIRPNVPFVETEVLRKYPMAAIFTILSSSGEIPSYFHGLSILDGDERKCYVKGMMLRYRLVGAADGRGAQFAALDVVPSTG